MTVAVVVGNPRPRSRTLRAASVVAERLTGHSPDLTLDLADLGAGLLDWSDASVAQAVADVSAADLLVVASPTYKATFTGLLKLFLDRFSAGALSAVTAVPLMLGGDWRHSLAPEAFLKPVLAELGASSPTRGLFLLDADADTGLVRRAGPGQLAARSSQSAAGSARERRRCRVSVTTEVPHPAQLRRVFGAFPSGVTAIAALVGGTPLGIAASSFTSVSLDPPLVSVCVAHSSTTWPLLRAAPRFGLSVLAADQEQACRQLSNRDGDRFADLQWRATADGAVLLDGASAWLECSTAAAHRAGDHDIVVLRVHDLDADHTVRPLVFHASQFRRLES